MNSFVTKLIVLAIIVGGLVMFVKFTSSAKKTIDEAQNPNKTFSDQVAEDDVRLRALPSDVVSEEIDEAQQKQEALNESDQDMVAGVNGGDEVAAGVNEGNGAKIEAEEGLGEVKVEVVREFKKMDEIDKIEAERLFETALTDRKIGRLPVTGYKMTVDNCRMIIQRFPGTEFDYKARRLLDDIPKRFVERYKLTDEEMDYESVGIVSGK